MQWSLYAIGSFGHALLSTALLSMYFYRYDPGFPNPDGLPILASSALVGSAALLGRVFNAIVTLTVGYLSDKTHSRWGRRRPFMAMALLPMLAGFILVFTPPLPYTNWWNAVYLAVTLVIFSASYSVYTIPYAALIVEIAQTVQQRFYVATLLTIFNLLGSVVGLVAAPWLVERLGFAKMAFILSIIGCISLVPPLAVRENLKFIGLQHPPFWKSLRLVGQNPIFRSYIISLIPMWLTITIFFLCGNYFVVALLHRSIGFSSVVSSAIITGVLIGVALVNLLAKHWGKKTTLQLSLMLFGFSLIGLSVWSLGARDTLWLCLSLFTLCGISIAALLIIPNVMTADIVDEGTKQIGTEQGAIYYGISGTVMIVVSGIASLLTGVILMLGKTPTQPLGVQVIYTVAGVSALGAAWILNSYSLAK